MVFISYNHKDEQLVDMIASFTPNEYLSIHRKLFTGIYSHVGRVCCKKSGGKEVAVKIIFCM